jgi:hypothetical protein
LGLVARIGLPRTIRRPAGLFAPMQPAKAASGFFIALIVPESA